MMFVAGIGLGFTYVMPYAMVPDAIEYDYLLTGERTEGSFYGIWTFMLKIGQALALAITGIVLQLTNYQENIIPQPDPMADFGILILLGSVPAAIFLMAIWTLYHYPITEERYKGILAEIEKMEAKK
jgi:GPH family glycoside/pentoside/hexuronide:cation symporter